MRLGIAAVLPFAFGVAMSPLPIMVVTIMLFSRRGSVNGPVFLSCWAGSLAVLVAAAYALTDSIDTSTTSTAQETIGWGKLAAGLVLLGLALRTWLTRTRPDQEPTLPAWMSGLDELSALRVAGLAVLLAAIKPKNLLLGIAAGSAVAQLGLPAGSAVASLSLFVVLASAPIATPVIYSAIGGERAATNLNEIKNWLAEHNDAMMIVLCSVFGAVLIANALPQLG